MCDWVPIGMNLADLVNQLFEMSPYDQPLCLQLRERTHHPLMRRIPSVPPIRNLYSLGRMRRNPPRKKNLRETLRKTLKRTLRKTLRSTLKKNLRETLRKTLKRTLKKSLRKKSLRKRELQGKQPRIHLRSHHPRIIRESIVGVI